MPPRSRKPWPPGDPDVVERVRRGAAVEGVGVGAFVASTIRQMLDYAEEDVWLDLLGRMSGSPRPGPDGMSIPDELARRETRLAKLAEVRAKIEARAKERFKHEQAEYEVKLAARQSKAETTGRKPGGKPPQPPVEGPLPTDQINLTDEDSRIMPVAGGGFEQCYNAQAVVAADSLLVVATDVVQAANDKQQLAPMVETLKALPEELGKPGTLLADNGYFSAANVTACEAASIVPMISSGRDGASCPPGSSVGVPWPEPAWVPAARPAQWQNARRSARGGVAPYRPSLRTSRAN